MAAFALQAATLVVYGGVRIQLPRAVILVAVLWMALPGLFAQAAHPRPARGGDLRAKVVAAMMTPVLRPFILFP